MGRAGVGSPPCFSGAPLQPAWIACVEGGVPARSEPQLRRSLHEHGQPRVWRPQLAVT